MKHPTNVQLSQEKLSKVGEIIMEKVGVRGQRRSSDHINLGGRKHGKIERESWYLFIQETSRRGRAPRRVMVFVSKFQYPNAASLFLS